MNPFAALMVERPRTRKHPGIPTALTCGATARRAILAFLGTFTQAELMTATGITDKEARRAIYRARSDGLIEFVRRAKPGQTAQYRRKP